MLTFTPVGTGLKHQVAKACKLLPYRIWQLHICTHIQSPSILLISGQSANAKPCWISHQHSSKYFAKASCPLQSCWMCCASLWRLARRSWWMPLSIVCSGSFLTASCAVLSTASTIAGKLQARLQVPSKSQGMMMTTQRQLYKAPCRPRCSLQPCCCSPACAQQQLSVHQ